MYYDAVLVPIGVNFPCQGSSPVISDNVFSRSSLPQLQTDTGRSLRMPVTSLLVAITCFSSLFIEDTMYMYMLSYYWKFFEWTIYVWRKPMNVDQHKIASLLRSDFSWYVALDSLAIPLEWKLSEPWEDLPEPESTSVSCSLLVLQREQALHSSLQPVLKMQP